MKKYKTILMAAGACILSFSGAQTSSAQTNTNLLGTNLFPAVVHAVCASTNKSGEIVYVTHSTSNIIQECATEKGVTNLAGLSLVFNRSNSAVQVVSAPSNTVICTPFTFMGGLSITNSTNTVVELQTFVFVETNTIASGILSATEHLTYGTSNQLTSFSLRGLLDYSTAAKGTNAATICRGTLLVGSAIMPAGGTGDDDNADNDNEDDDDGGNGGNQGHHHHGNNGKHLGQLKH